VSVSPLLVSLLALVLASPLLWIIRPHRFRHAGWFAALPPAVISGWLLTQLPNIAVGNVLTVNVPWAEQLGMELALRVDGLALFFGLIIMVIGTAIALYTGYYFEDEPRQGYFYALLFLFMASMLGLVWADNLLALYLFWEGTSITSYLLIAFKDTDEEAKNGAERAFLVTGLGGLAMLFGLVLLANSAGTYTLSEILVTPGLTTTAVAPAILILVFIGAFTKSAQFPFHFWLPGAMAAPTPASAYLHSATMVKAGIYLLARLHPALSDHPLWFWGLLLIGGVTMLLGAYFALSQYDIKALLAYATVSQLGIIVMLLAFRDQAAYTAAIVGILAHALYKGPLFMVAGIVDHATGTRDLRRLANLRQQLPMVTVIAFLAALSMAGIIPMFGFLAKELLLENFIHASETSALTGWTGLVFTAIASAFTVAASITLFWEGFMRPKALQSPAALVHHLPSRYFVLPPLVLVLIGTAIPFLLAPLEALLFSSPVSSIAATNVQVHLALWHGFNLALSISLALIAVGALLFAKRASIRAFSLRWPQQFNSLLLWDRVIDSIYALATWVTREVQGNTLPQQARGPLLAGVAIMIYALSAARWPEDFPINWSTLPHAAEVIMALLAVFAAIITVKAATRLGAIISIGVVGIAVTLFFVFNSAPDLALTQLLVDILLVVLLVLVFYKIPPKRASAEPEKLGVRNVGVAVLVGLLGFFMVLFTVSEPFFPPIGDYFLLNAVGLGHGGNVVNVILVDFRGFDTFGEIVVLGVAAVGGYAVFRAGLFRMRQPQPLADDTTTTHAESQLQD
jgi:multicomponent Na+:H+ antiporter subunit A